MKAKTKLVAIGCLLSALCLPAFAQGTTAFTYQGQLHDTGTNANGNYTMIFALYDASTNGDQIGSPIITNAMLANGLFSVDLDFGAGVFNGKACWLDITVTNGGTTQTLSPRVPVLPEPYAQFAAVAATVTNGAIMNAELAGNAVNSTNIQTGAVTTLLIANGAVGSAQIANGAVGSSQLASNLTVSGTLVVSNGLQIDGTAWNVSVGMVAAPVDSPVSTFTNALVFSVNGLPCLDLVTLPGGVPYVYDPNGFYTTKLNCQGGHILVSDTNGNTVASIDTGGNISANGNISGNNISGDNLTLGGWITCEGVNAGTFNTTSDRNLKEKFTPINYQQILERVAGLPISSWNFKTDANTRHIGPMAQDFYAAFKVGADDKHIATVDEDGVALAAIQGLNEKLKEKDIQIEALEKRLVDLERLVKTSTKK